MFEIERTINMKMDLALNNKGWYTKKPQKNNQPTNLKLLTPSCGINYLIKKSYWWLMYPPLLTVKIETGFDIY